MAAPGAYKNPALRRCWETCGSCGRCTKMGTSACPLRGICSGRYDPHGQIDADIDDFCDCKNGVLRWKTKEGRRIIVKYYANPFMGRVRTHNKTEDERDWDSYLQDMRERLDNPDYNPIVIS